MIDYTKATIDRATQDNSTQLIFQYYADQLKTYYSEMSNSLIQKEIKTYFYWHFCCCSFLHFDIGLVFIFNLEVFIPRIRKNIKLSK